MNTQYWEEEIETMSREKLQELQLQRLILTVMCQKMINFLRLL